jgi:hypothetical protein
MNLCRTCSHSRNMRWMQLDGAAGRSSRSFDVALTRDWRLLGTLAVGTHRYGSVEMATARRRDLEDNVARQPSRPTRLFVVFCVALCVAAVAASAAIADYPRPKGARISEATISNARVTISCTFHKTHSFFAQIYANPSNVDPASSSRIRWVRTIPLGEHHAGHGHVSFLLGTLAPGNYGIVLLPTHAVSQKPWLSTPGVGPATGATWLLLTVKHNGKVVVAGLHQPA